MSEPSLAESGADTAARTDSGVLHNALAADTVAAIDDRKVESTDLRLLPGAVCAWCGALAVGSGGIPRRWSTGVALVLIVAAVAIFFAEWRRSAASEQEGKRACEGLGASSGAVAFCEMSESSEVGASGCLSAVRLREGKAGGSWCSAVALAGFIAAAALLCSGAARATHFADPVYESLVTGTSSLSVVATLITDPSELQSRWGKGHFTADVKALCQVIVDDRSLKTEQEDLRTIDPSDPHMCRSSSVQIMVMAEGMDELARGDVIAVSGRVDTSFRADPPFVGTMRVTSFERLERPSGWRGWVRDLRANLVDATEGLSGQARALVPGMAVGDDRAMGSDLKDAMLTSSLSHLTAVSGSHVAIMISLVVLIVPGRGLLRAGATLVLIVVLLAVVGPDPSVQRSALTAGVGVCGLLLRRSGQSQSALSAVVIGVIICDPWAAYSIGFALSVLATWGVIGPAASWNRHLQNKAGEENILVRILVKCAPVVLVPIAAQMMVAPVLVLLNPWLPTWGVVANVLAAPAVAPASLMGLAATCTAGWAPQLAHILCGGAGFFTGWIAGVAETIAAWPMARLPFFGGAGGAMVLLSLGSVAALVNWWRKSKGRGVTHR